MKERSLKKLAKVGKSNSLSPGRVIQYTDGIIYFSYYTEDTDNSDNSVCKIISVNAENGETDEILSEKDALISGIDNDNFLYRICNDDETKTDVYEYDTKSGESTKLFDYDGYATNTYILEDTAVFNGTKNGTITVCTTNLKTGQTDEYEFSENEYFNIETHTQKGFVVFHQNDEKNIYDSALITDEDMLSLSLNKMKYKKSS